MASLVIFAVEVWTVPGPGLDEMVLGPESHKNMTEVNKQGNPETSDSLLSGKGKDLRQSRGRGIIKW